MSEATVVDLSSMMPAETATLEIMKPGNIEPTGWVITLAGPGHPKAQAYINDAARRNLRKAQQLEAAALNRRKVKPEDKDLDEVRRENVAYVVSRIVGWTPVKLGAGDAIAFSDEAATELFMKPELSWVMQQILDAIEDERAFTKGSAKT